MKFFSFSGLCIFGGHGQVGTGKGQMIFLETKEQRESRTKISLYSGLAAIICFAATGVLLAVV
ncbi:hypothetical protein BpJC7_03190 [Weizmannia acidilactici]|uniref:Uncharacterized protein n=1 Tax=Weizmannia acidilactici TaxID=2607726 RepID=A0A5J4J246_9BACI|nr:hypothetical protein BpJC7_03190 [Weizmannia acidilactici]